MTPENLNGIFYRLYTTMCKTISASGSRVEGRISLEDATALRGHIRVLTEALQPFADACGRADQSSEEVRRSRMGPGHSDDATPGWDVRYRHLKAARAALRGEE